MSFRSFCYSKLTVYALFCIGISNYSFIQSMQNSLTLVDLPSYIIKDIALPETKKYEDIVKKIHSCGELVEVNKHFKELLFNDFRMLKALIRGANVYDPKGETHLLRAIRNNDIQNVTFLIDHGAHLEKPDRIGHENPLLCAVRSNNCEAVRLLLKNNIDVNGKTLLRMPTPLYVAVDEKFRSIVKVLLEHAAIDVNSESSYYWGKIPLHAAAYNDDEEMVRLLLNKGADKNKIDKNGNKPYHFASDEKIIELLNAEEI